MRIETKNSDHKKFIRQIEARQQNTVWPGHLINSRGVDEFLWRGNPDAPLVQRMAAWIFGVAFMIVGLALLCIAYDKHSWIDIVVSLMSFLIGSKIFLNGFRRRSSKKIAAK